MRSKLAKTHGGSFGYREEEASSTSCLDGRTILRSTAASGVWKPLGNLEKMLNVHITAGRHLLRISKPEPMGIPWISKMQFRKAKDLTGMVRIEPIGDCLALRKGEPLGLRLKAGKVAAVQHVNVAVMRRILQGPSLHQEDRRSSRQGRLRD